MVINYGKMLMSKKMIMKKLVPLLSELNLKVMAFSTQAGRPQSLDCVVFGQMTAK